MGNPHPTKSKPFKIGRKHTGAKSLRAIGRMASKAIKEHRAEIAKWCAFKKEVSDYWRGLRDSYPQKPNEKGQR